MRTHSKRRHPKTGEVIQDLVEGLEPKVISFKWKVPYNTVIDIKNKFVGIIRYVKPVRDPNQYEFDV